MRWLVGTLMAVASASFAEGTPEDEAELFRRTAQMAAMWSCVESSESEVQASECVNLTREECLGGTSLSSADESTCAEEEARLLEFVLVLTLARAVDRAALADEELYRLTLPGPSNVPMLFRSQSDWESYRHSQCDLEMLKWGSGRIVSTARPYCEAQMLLGRIWVLHNLRFG